MCLCVRGREGGKERRSEGASEGGSEGGRERARGESERASECVFVCEREGRSEGARGASELTPRVNTGRASERARVNPAFTRYCYHQYCMVYGIQKGGRGGVLYFPNSRAIVLQQCGRCRRAERMKGRLIRAQTTRSKRISCKGQPPTVRVQG